MGASVSVAVESRKAVAGSNNVSNAFRRMREESKKTNRGLAGTDKALNKAGKSGARLKRVIGGLVAGFSGMLILRSVIKVIAGFEESMATLQGITGRTADQMKDFTDVARNLGATTKFSAQEAADGLIFLARAGFTANEAIAAIPDTLNLAAAASLELGEAADIASNVLSQFNLSAEETGRVGDVLVNVANRANTDVRQLAEALKLVGPVAGAIGKTIEQTAAAIGVLGDSGVQASLAGTNLRGVISALLSPTSKASKAIESMRINLDDVNPATQSLVSIFEKFKDANLTAADAVQIFGRRNAAAALIMANSTKKMQALEDASIKFRGVSEKVAKLMSTTMTGAFKGLISSIQESFIAIGESGFGGALKSTVVAITGTVRALVGMGHTLGENREAYETAASTVKAFALIVGSLVAIKLGIWLTSAAFGVKALTAAMIANPITAVAVVLAGLISALIIFSQESGEAARSTERLNKAINTIKQSVGEFERVQVKLNRALEVQDKAEELSAKKEKLELLKKESLALRSLKNDEKELFETRKVSNLLEQLDIKPVRGLGTGGKLQADQIFERLVPGKSLGRDLDVFAIEVDDLVKIIESRISKLTKSIEDEGGKQKNALKDIVSKIKGVKDNAERALSGGLKVPLIDPERLKNLNEGAERLRTFGNILGDVLAKEKDRASLVGLSGADLSARETMNMLMREALDLAKLEGRTGEFRIERAKQIVDAFDEETRAILRQREATEALVKAEAERIKKQNEIKRIARSVGQTFSRAFEDMILQTKSLSDALKQLANDLTRLVTRQLVTGPIAAAISGAITSSFNPGGTGTTADPFRGGVDSGSFIPRAAGGVVTGPMALGDNNIVGEAGPEAILPLKRTSSGGLGVVAAGGGGSGSKTVVIHIHGISNVDEFRKSRPQLAQDFARILK